MAPSRVLVPLDGSPLAEDALLHAVETFDCPITVLNVVTELDDSMSESGILDAGEYRPEDARERVEDVLAEVRERTGVDDRRVETAVETGDPADTIVEYVESTDVDHVVMGGHGGAKGVAGRLLGTVATTVVSEAPVTVTVVR